MSPIRQPLRTKPIAWLFALAAATGLAAQAEDLLHARVSLESGGALVRGTQDDDWSYATVNTILLPGDTLWIDQEGTLEAEMSGGSFLRMADKSKVELQALPPNGSINAWAGSFYVQRVSRSTGDLKLRTPAATINIDRDTQVRVDVVGEGSTTVSVRWGRVTVATEGGAPVEVSNGQRVYVDPGLLPSNPVPFDKTAEDSFDAWNRERARLLALGDNALPTSVRVENEATPIGYSDLASYGEWVNVDNRQQWRPTIVQDYVPYRDGYWSYGPSYGYSWTGSYPFCYVTSHYGRWNYYPAYGWMWGYDPVWSPAWCATAYYGGNFVWCPLNYYNRPCSYGSTFYVGGVPFSVGFSSYCYGNDLYYGPSSVYPCYNDLFVNVHPNNIYGWNIYGGNYHNKNPHWGSNAMYRDYNPRRVIRGIQGGAGGFTVAAGQRARALNSELGRAQFASNTGREGSRSVRTSQSSNGRHASIRNTVLNSENTALDTGSTIRRGQRQLESLRGTDDNKPHATEARRARMASLERSANEAPNSKLPGATSRMSSSRNAHSDTNAVDTINGRRERSNGNAIDTDRNRGNRAANPQNEITGGPSDATMRDRDPALRNRNGNGNNVNTASPNVRPAERSADREARRLDTDTPHIGNAPNNRDRSASGTSRTLDDTRVRTKAPGNNGNAPMTNPAQTREPNLPRIPGGDGRNERSQSLGSIPKNPQRTQSAFNAPVQSYTPEPSSSAPRTRIIHEGGASNGNQNSAQSNRRPAGTQAPVQMESPRINNAPRTRYEAPMNTQQRVEAPQRFEAPQPQFNAPRVERSAPQVNVPQRFEAPQQQFQAPQRFEAPQPRLQAPQRFEAPQPRFEAPQRAEAPQRFQAPQVDRSPGMRSMGGDGGGSRVEGHSGGGGGGRGRSR